MRTLTIASRISRIMKATAILCMFSACYLFLSGYSSQVKTVDVSVNITLTIGSTKDAYLIVTDLHEQYVPSTLVKPGAPRIVTYGMNVLNSPMF